ncbi:protein-tyrosine phosphatase family protein [Chromobacterium amazonense]|uniref:protein-tyrosine phosphatase family protein n=1 Tax=Chromobacterium amazonense TaxID=1382803 RepID=UPI00237E243B|nr:protein-tyrosine phosphatase family protein [Chromobacterium amazonense]MDE1716335.1 protein-tyrosine phosphatase family protein [Chromobacterium amazonense]
MIQTLPTQYRDGALRDAGIDLTNPKPLTKRLIQQVEQSVERQQRAEPVHVSFSDLRATQNSASPALLPRPLIPDLLCQPSSAQGAVKDVQTLRGELDARLEHVARPDYAAPKSITHARFKTELSNVRGAVPTASHTQVDPQLPVNRVEIEGRRAALAGQFPHDTPQALGAHLRMLVEQGCSSLMVLAGHDQVRDGNLPYYFKEGTRIYDSVTITSTTPNGGKINLDGLHVHRYMLTITVPGCEPFTLPALHVTNWPDHGTVKDAAQLEKLAKLARKVDDEGRGLRGDAIAALPMIHCRGGVGRTGTLIAAMELIKPDSKVSLQRIIADQRTTRNHRMAEDVGQREQLVELAQRQGKAVLEPSEPLYANV